MTALLCLLVGNSQLLMFLGAAMFVLFIILMMTGDSNGSMPTFLRIGIGFAILLQFPAIFGAVFPSAAALNCVAAPMVPLL